MRFSPSTDWVGFLGLVGLIALIGYVFISPEDTKETPQPTPAPTEASTYLDPYGTLSEINFVSRLNQARNGYGLPAVGYDQYLSGEAEKIITDNCPVKSNEYYNTESKNGEFRKYYQTVVVGTNQFAAPKDAISDLADDPKTFQYILNAQWPWSVVGIAYREEPMHCLVMLLGD